MREFKVTEYEPNKKVTVRLMTPSSSIQNAEVHDFLEPEKDGTRLAFQGTLEVGGFLRLIQPILLQRAKRDGKGDLDNLKRLLETQTDAHPDPAY